MKIKIVLAVTMSIFIYSPVYSASLKEISEFAKDICDEISVGGNINRKQIEGKIEGNVSGLAKLIGASVGVDGTLKIDDTNYTGLPYENVAEQMTGARDCRQQLATMLIDERDRISKEKINSNNKKNITNKASNTEAKSSSKISYVGPYTVELLDCASEAGKIKCNFTIMIEDGGEAYFHRKSHKGTSLIYLPNGVAKGAYKLNIGNAGGTKERFGVRLPPDVPIRGSVEFRGVNTKSIKLLELGVARTVLHNPQYARFRDIVVTGE